MKFNTLKAICVSILLSQSAIAGQVNNAAINTVTALDTGLVRVTISGGTEVTSKAGCSASTNNNEFIYDINSAAGQGWHSMVLTAQTTQKKFI